MNNKSLSVLAFTAALGFAGAADAGLINRGGGLIYDDVLDITWLQNANLAATETFGLSTGVSLGTHPNDTSGINGVIYAGGYMNWPGALFWIDAMNDANYLGYDDWRLPTVEPISASFNYNFSNNGSTDYGYGITSPNSEMSYMYYENLGNKGYCTPDNSNPNNCNEQSGWGLTHTSFTDAVTGDSTPIQNLQNSVYWSGTEYAPYPNFAWRFLADDGGQNAYYKDDVGYAWAVRPGDVAAAPPSIPEPGSLTLVGLGLVGLGWARRRRG
jgi:hypothetical protein